MSMPAEDKSNIRFQIIFISYLKNFSCIKTSVKKLTYHALYVQIQVQISSKLRMLHLFIKRQNRFSLSRPNVRGNAPLSEKTLLHFLVFNHCISMDRWVAVFRVLFTTLVNENFKISFHKMT